MKYFIYILIALSLISCSREEYLDIKPKGIIIPGKLNDYRLLLDQVGYTGNSISPGFSPTHNNTDLMSDDISFESSVLGSFLSGVDLAAYSWADQIYTPDQEDRDWQTLYGQIYVSNFIIEEVLNASTGSLEEKLQLQGEALAHRAFAYFILVNEYALHYNPDTATSTPGVPLRLDTRLSGVDLTRASVKAVYDQILDDLNQAVDNLPDIFINNINHRPSKAGVNGLLSKVHLYMGNWQAALEASSAALAIKNDLLDLNLQPNWFLPVIKLPDYNENPEYLWYKESSFPSKNLPYSSSILELIDDNDQRRRFKLPVTLFGIPGDGFFNSFVYVHRYRFTGISTADVYLIRAEANARLGNVGAALSDLNTLIEKRTDSGTFEPFNISDPNELLQQIKDERRIELMATGNRFFDLKRYNVFDNANISIVHKYPDGSSVELQANSKNWAVPIASKYILLNPEIGENDRE